jgi:CheY-like chemotaxis protein
MMNGIEKVIVVDDNAHFRKLLRIVLASFGVADVVEAKDGAEAVTMLASFDADIAIMD